MWLSLGATLALIVFATLIGLRLPDIDFWLPLNHRSALTHSILPAALLLGRPWLRPVAAGLALGIGLHLSADTFPDAMIGYATIKMPLMGSIGAGASYMWLAGNAGLCVALGSILATRLLPNANAQRCLAVALILIGCTYLLQVDNGWIALLGYTGLGLVGYRAARAGVLPPRLGVFSR